MTDKKTQPEEPKKEITTATAETPEKTEEAGEVKKAKRSKKLRAVHEGCIYIHASYNNTIVTFTDTEGNTIAWSSAGASGFKGARKSTPYAAQIASENAAKKAEGHGFEKAHVYIKGIGPGREQSVRALISAGIELLSITDTTPIAHNGCRQKKQRRV